MVINTVINTIMLNSMVPSKRGDKVNKSIEGMEIAARIKNPRRDMSLTILNLSPQ